MKHYAMDLVSKLTTGRRCPSMMRESIGENPHMNVMKKKENNKGFTLVELIVVIVILAILAALLVPALLGWIDKAKEEQYALEARNIYLATQAQISENYAAGTAANAITYDKEKIEDLADVEVKDIKMTLNGTGTNQEDYEINSLIVIFVSSNNDKVKGTLLPNKSWKFEKTASDSI